MTKKIELKPIDNIPGAYAYLVGWLKVEMEYSRRITPASWNHAVEMAEKFSAEERERTA